MKAALFFMATLLMASVADAQERPLAQQLLDPSVSPTPDSTVVDADRAPSVAVSPGQDSAAVDYVPPDAGAPGSLREKQENMGRRAMRKNRSAVRLGIGIPLGLFSGIWISF
ncbi:MAG: hypothetical protein IPL52_17630 [Flavobacteriales bacterium]|nr:hypothetical protein [Flavobacteriales bacterium]